MREPLESAEVAAQRIGKLIREQTPSGYKFLAFLASVGHGGYCTYISNVDRDSAVAMVVEWLEMMKHRDMASTDIDSQCWCCGSKGPGIEASGSVRSVRLCVDCYLTMKPAT